MDKIGGLMNKLGGSSSNTTAGQPAAGQTTTTGTAGATGQQDYGDKGLAFLEQKTGHNMGASTNEKITDGARGLYEKTTGSKVNPKYSN